MAGINQEILRVSSHDRGHTMRGFVCNFGQAQLPCMIHPALLHPMAALRIMPLRA